MADSKKKQTKVYLIPESESRDSHTYHYLAIKTKKLVIENQKLRMKKYNPATMKHEWFVEKKLPPKTFQRVHRSFIVNLDKGHQRSRP